MGSSAKKVEAGEHEKALVENANTIANRNKELYRPLEAGFVKESGRDVSGVLGGRANADTAQAFSSSQGAGLGASGSSGGFGSGRSMMTQANQGVIQSNALGGALAGASKTAQTVKDGSQLGAVKVGQGGRSVAMQGLSQAARAQNQEIVAKSQAASSMQDTSMAFASDLGAGLYKKFNPTPTPELDRLQAQIDSFYKGA
ncbi:hypothetical protein OAD64_00250 [Oceanospirillaceae bacterium]|nr:hypothetical protein [Oceanospirillaceae bacterium]